MSAPSADAFIGAGFAFPMRLAPNGSIALVTREREIEESIHLILGTAKGERPMRPAFGCGIHDLVFAEANGTTAGLVAAEVRQSLVRWEPRIDVVAVDVTVDEDDRSRLLISIVYAVRGTNDRRNLVFPFYVIPSERS